MCELPPRANVGATGGGGVSNEHLDRVDQTLNDKGVDRLLEDVEALGERVAAGEVSYDTHPVESFASAGSLVGSLEDLIKRPRTPFNFDTLDSGERVEFDSGMVRDTDDGKPRYDLIPIMPLRRLADLYARGAVKYGDCNWQNANSEEELQRFKASGLRHYYQYLNGERDEDHAAAVVFNVFAQMWLEEKMASA